MDKQKMVLLTTSDVARTLGCTNRRRESYKKALTKQLLLFCQG
ncbi:MAG: hypothetical protein ACI4V4_01130 [Eubacterium sp.]